MGLRREPDRLDVQCYLQANIERTDEPSLNPNILLSPLLHEEGWLAAIYRLNSVPSTTSHLRQEMIHQLPFRLAVETCLAIAGFHFVMVNLCVNLTGLRDAQIV